MAEHLSEEEQIEAIKAWWQENWLLIVVPVVLLTVGYGSWSFYQHNKESTARSASDEYQLLLSELEKGGDKPSSEQISKIRDKATIIAGKYSDSLYADMSNMILARFDVEQGNLDGAESRLRTVVKNAATEAMESLAKVRLAKVLIDQEKLDEALTLVASTDQEAYKAQFAETRGDAFYVKGDMGAARTAYEEAMANLSAQGQARRNLIQLKLNGTKVSWSAAKEKLEAPAPELTKESAEGDS